MDTDLLAREDEYKKLNKQLQKKTESLMKEIEYVMQKPDVYSEFITSLYSNRRNKNLCDTSEKHTPPSSTNRQQTRIKKKTGQAVQKCTSDSNLVNNCPRKNVEFDNGSQKTENSCVNCVGRCTKIINCICCPDNAKTNGDMEFLYAFVSLNVKDNILPQSFMKNPVTVESVCKCMLSKIKLLQEEIDKLQNIITRKTSQCESHLTQLAEMESERMSLLNKTNSMKAATADMKAKCCALQNKLEEKDRLYKELRSEEDKHTTELKKLRSRNINLEARCASQDETIDTLKQQLETSKKLEKEMRECNRAMSASHETVLSRSGARQRSIEAFVRTQAALIENLRRQLALITTDGALKYLHDEYTKLLSRDF